MLTGDGVDLFDFQRGGLETAGRNGRLINLNYTLGKKMHTSESCLTIDQTA